MTKSLGRTYSLLNFSGREMHYWPGNLPRRRVCVMSLGRVVYVRCYRDVTSACSRVSKKNATTCHSVSSSYFASLLLHPPRSPAVGVVALTLLAALRKRTCPGTPSHVRKVTGRLLFLQTTMSLSQSTRARNLNGEIRSRGNTPEESRRETKYVIRQSDYKEQFLLIFINHKKDESISSNIAMNELIPNYLLEL